MRNWKNIAAIQGLLFFAQRMDEMLFYYTMDTYKPQIYNIVLLLNEYFTTVQKIESGILNEKNEPIIIDEIVWMLNNDNVAREVIGEFIVEEFIKNRGSYGKDKRKRMLSLFLSKVIGNEYLEHLKVHIKEAVELDKKSDIEKYSILYVRELTVVGYDARYIFKCLNNVFYTNEVSNLDSLDRFFSCFDSKKHKYDVMFEVDRELASLCEKMQSKSILDGLDVLKQEEIMSSISAKEGYAIVSFRQIEAFDEFVAYETGSAILQMLNNFYTYFRYVSSGIEPGGYVRNEEGHIETIKEKVSGVDKTRKIQSFERSYASTADLFDIATANYENLYKMSRIMEIHNTAIATEAQNNVLLSLWSILELLLEENETDNNHSRIMNIMDLVIPSLINSYIEKIVLDLYEDVRRFEHNKTPVFLSKVEEHCNEFEKFFAFLVLDKYDYLRSEFYSKLSEYPLLRYRIYSLNIELKDKKRIQKKLDRHEQKLRWHLQRLYRTRNCIIHDGEDIYNIDALVENLLGYIDIVCERIIHSISHSVGIHTVSNAILEEELNYKLFFEKVNDDKVNEVNFMKFLYHRI